MMREILDVSFVAIKRLGSAVKSTGYSYRRKI